MSGISLTLYSLILENQFFQSTGSLPFKENSSIRPALAFTQKLNGCTHLALHLPVEVFYHNYGDNWETTHLKMLQKLERISCCFR